MGLNLEEKVSQLNMFENKIWEEVNDLWLGKQLITGYNNLNLLNM